MKIEGQRAVAGENLRKLSNGRNFASIRWHVAEFARIQAPQELGRQPEVGVQASAWIERDWTFSTDDLARRDSLGVSSS